MRKPKPTKIHRLVVVKMRMACSEEQKGLASFPNSLGLGFLICKARSPPLTAQSWGQGAEQAAARGGCSTDASCTHTPGVMASGLTRNRAVTALL